AAPTRIVLSAPRAVDDQLVRVCPLGREPYAFSTLRALNGSPRSRSRCASRRPDDLLCPLPQLPADIDRFAAEHESRGLEQHLVLRRPNLGLDDLDEVSLLAADQAGDPIPAAHGAFGYPID